MTILQADVNAMNQIFQQHHIPDTAIDIQPLSGTTSSLVLKVKTESGRIYIVKKDDPLQLRAVETFLKTYKNSTLLPKILFAAEDRSYLAYSFAEGTTHVNRGSKRQWMSVLVAELLQTYVSYSDLGVTDWVEHSQDTWKQFNLAGLAEARLNIGDLLSPKDHDFVKDQAENLFKNNLEGVDQFLLHGDTGVHNFVFRQSRLVGVIDPSPMVGPLLYDFLYAFCSSPDDINRETLDQLAALLEQNRVDTSRINEEVRVQLYCRIGLCIKHHPHDLPGYLQAWKEWNKNV